jgi:hypothetical protein
MRRRDDLLRRAGWTVEGIILALLPACSQRSLDIQVEQKPVCAVETQAGPLRRISNDVQSASIGACGQLEFLDGRGALWLTAPEIGDPTQVAESVVGARFAPSGDFLGFATSEKSAEGSLFHVKGLNGEQEFERRLRVGPRLVWRALG